MFGWSLVIQSHFQVIFHRSRVGFGINLSSSGLRKTLACIFWNTCLTSYRVCEDFSREWSREFGKVQVCQYQTPRGALIFKLAVKISHSQDKNSRDTLLQLVHVLSDDWITFHQVLVVVPWVSNVIQSQVDKFANCGEVCDPRRIGWKLYLM